VIRISSEEKPGLGTDNITKLVRGHEVAKQSGDLCRILAVSISGWRHFGQLPW